MLCRAIWMGNRLVTQSSSGQKNKTRVQKEVDLLHAPRGIRKQGHCFSSNGKETHLTLRQCGGL